MAHTKTFYGLFLIGALMLGGAKDAPRLEAAILAEHNMERAALGLQPLRWSEELAHGAQQWADQLVRSGRFEHSPDLPGQPQLGENIWGGTAGRFEPRRMVAAWISEKRHFKPGVFPFNSTTSSVGDVSHYTQIIWRSTDEVGCAISRGSSEDILVCRYRSPGNLVGRSPI